MPTPLTPMAAVSYVLSRAQLNNALTGWTDAAGQAWNIVVVSMTAGDSGMMTHMRLRFDPVLLTTLLPDTSRTSQSFDIGVAARDVDLGSIAPASWV